jgi:hypothetical protein
MFPALNWQPVYELHDSHMNVEKLALRVTAAPGGMPLEQPLFRSALYLNDHPYSTADLAPMQEPQGSLLPEAATTNAPLKSGRSTVAAPQVADIQLSSTAP